MKEAAGDWGAKTAKSAQSETKTPHRLTGEERREKSTQKGASLVAQCLGPLAPKAGGPRFNPWSGNEDPTCQMSHRLQRRSQISCAAAKTKGSQINTKKKKKRKKKKKGRKKSTERNKEADGGDKTNTKGPVPEHPPTPAPRAHQAPRGQLLPGIKVPGKTQLFQPVRHLGNSLEVRWLTQPRAPRFNPWSGKLKKEKEVHSARLCE